MHFGQYRTLELLTEPVPPADIPVHTAFNLASKHHLSTGPS
jgi:hypothetical protein